MSWTNLWWCGAISRSNHCQAPTQHGQAEQRKKWRRLSRFELRAAWCFDVKAHQHSKPGAWSYLINSDVAGEGSQAWLGRMIIGEILDDRLGA